MNNLYQSYVRTTINMPIDDEFTDQCTENSSTEMPYFKFDS